MQQLLQDAYNRATSQNYLYGRHRQRWQFLLNSYVGGEEYRKAAYLSKYQLESDAEYARRLQNTPLDNQCKSVISLYVSFLFRQEPKREFGSLENSPVLTQIIEDSDLDGRNINAFMKDVAIWSQVFGHCWVCVSKPNVGAITAADELALGARPYLSVLTPLVVTDWRWARQASGAYGLDMIKYVEEVNDTETIVKEWNKETIRTTIINNKKNEAIDYIEEVNELGQLPFILVYSERSPVRGIGLSIIDDIADQQRAEYNELSEIEQSIRLDSHPSLVATAETNIGTGAGALIQLPENLDPALKPYVLEFSGAPVASIYSSIEARRRMIDTMANVGSVRATETREMSGVAIETEFQLLNARLSAIADNLELAEEQIWQWVCEYVGVEWNGSIDYPDNFALRNVDNELKQLTTVYQTVQNAEMRAAIEHELSELVDLDLEEYVGSPETVSEETDESQHPITTPENRAEHIQAMIMEGYEDDEILDIHPEITAADILAAKQALLNLNG
jgi:hypothetical protein